MRKSVIGTFVKALIIGIIFWVSTAHSQEFVPGEVIVKYKNVKGVRASNAFARKAVGRRMAIKAHFARLNMYHLALPSGESVEAAVNDLKQDEDVEYVEPNYLLQKADNGGVEHVYSAAEVQTLAASGQVVSTGSEIGLLRLYQQNAQWGGQVNALAARPIVAVIDTGLDLTHSVIVNTNAVWTNPGEIASNGIDDDGNGYVDDVNGWNFVSGTGQMLDDDGHGTHVAGIILSVDQNIFAANLQVSKVALMPLKFLNANGSGSTSNAIRAIYYAVENGAAVLNNSWGGSYYSASLNEAIAYSYNAGTVFVAAAGNNGSNNDASPMYPASYNVPNIISTAAITDQDDLASFSNYGANSVALGSPGVFILSLLPGNRFGSMSGTSMATPFVAGTAGQMKVNSPNMLGYQVKSLILGETTGLGSLHMKVSTSGKLNTIDALNSSSTAQVDASQPVYVMSYSDRGLASSLAGGGCGIVTKMNGSDGSSGPGLGGIVVTFIIVLAPMLYLLYRRLNNPINRRRYDRFRISSEVRINVGDKELVGSVSSISLGGVQVNTSALLQNGGLVTLSIASPDGAERIEVEGRVVWSESNKAYGVAFDQTPQTVLSQISQWTKALQRT